MPLLGVGSAGSTLALSGWRERRLPPTSPRALAHSVYHPRQNSLPCPSQPPRTPLRSIRLAMHTLCRSNRAAGWGLAVAVHPSCICWGLGGWCSNRQRLLQQLPLRLLPRSPTPNQHHNMDRSGAHASPSPDRRRRCLPTPQRRAQPAALSVRSLARSLDRSIDGLPS